MTRARAGETTEALITRADAAMYEVKKAHHDQREAAAGRRVPATGSVSPRMVSIHQRG